LIVVEDGLDAGEQIVTAGTSLRRCFADRKPLSRRNHAAAPRIQRLAHILLRSLQQEGSNQTLPNMGI
jgi:hypothetical protein